MDTQSQVTVAKAVEMYRMAHRTDVSQSTRLEYALGFIVGHWGGEPVSRLNPGPTECLAQLEGEMIWRYERGDSSVGGETNGWILAVAIELHDWFTHVGEERHSCLLDRIERHGGDENAAVDDLLEEVYVISSVR